MKEILEIKADEKIINLFLEKEMRFKNNNARITIENKKLSFTIDSKNKKDILRAKNSLNNIAQIYKKIKAL